MDKDKDLPIHLGLKAIQMSREVDWKEVLTRYRDAYREWTLTPSWLWILLAILGAVGIPSIPDPWNYSGVALIGLSCWILGSRSPSADERFQIGYEWGLEDGVCAGLGRFAGPNGRSGLCRQTARVVP